MHTMGTAHAYTTILLTQQHINLHLYTAPSVASDIQETLVTVYYCTCSLYIAMQAACTAPEQRTMAPLHINKRPLLAYISTV